MKYYIEGIHYYKEELRGAEKFLLPLLGSYVRMIVSSRWVTGLVQYLKGKQEEFLKVHPQAKEIEVLADLAAMEVSGSYIRARDPAVCIGKITMHLIPVLSELEFFEVPLFENKHLQ